jgi:hypothetical protein
MPGGAPIGADPVTVTGYHIGDKIRHDAPAPWLSSSKGLVVDLVPDWIAVGIDNGDSIVGYQRRDSVIDLSLPPLIYDETGSKVVGCFSSVAVISDQAARNCHANG